MHSNPLPISNWVIFLYIFYYSVARNSSYALDTVPYQIYDLKNIFSHSRDCFLTFLMV